VSNPRIFIIDEDKDKENIGEKGATKLTQSLMFGFVVACPTIEICLLK
jgi:hypothetical protein